MVGKLCFFPLYTGDTHPSRDLMEDAVLHTTL
jgi:hypothetical protein